MDLETNAYVRDLRQAIASAFDIVELQDLVFDLDLDWDELPGQIKSRKAQALILTMAQMGHLEALINELRRIRPLVAWPEAPPRSRQGEFLKTATVTAAIAVGAAAAGIGFIDGFGDDLIFFLSQAPNPIPPQHRLMFEGNEGEIVARWRGQPVRRITAEDLANLPPEEMRHVSVLEASMERHYQRWEELYPQRGNSFAPADNAAIDHQLRQLVSNMADDLDGILSFLELMGFQLDDHYLRYRHLINQARR